MSFYNELEKYFSYPAIITERAQELNYRDLLKAADFIGGQIKKRCLILMVCKNCFESLAGYLGLLRAGGVLALVNDLQDSLFFHRLLEVYRPSYIYLPRENSVLNITGTPIESLGQYLLLKTGYAIDYSIHDDLALLLTTSGSTGSPKFVRQSYKNIDSNTEAIVQYLEISASDRPITTLPMSYTYGLSIINSHLLQGASIILTESTLMEQGFWKMLKEHQATTFGGVPYSYEMLKKLRFERMNLPSLNYITQAGGKLSLELSTEFADICDKKSIRFFVMYGQTEATARMSYLPWQFARKKAGSMGIAIPGGRFWLEDEEGAVIDSSGVSGELIYQGDNVTLGYAESRFDLYKDDEKGGILYTGDIAQRDADGFYYIVGRKKRFLKMFGNRINLNEIEQIIKSIGYDGVCAGCDDQLKIFITDHRSKERVRKEIAARTGINQAGITVLSISEIPRNESGKVLYTELDQRIEAKDV